MPTVYDVPPDLLIKRLSERLKRNPQINPPPWTGFAKTGSHAERPPQDRDWWYVRCASLLRKIYIYGPIGLNDLRSKYGGRLRRGLAPAQHRDAGGSAIRKALQHLEAAKLVAKKEREGRVVTNEGRKLLDKVASEIFKELVKENPYLVRYS